MLLRRLKEALQRYPLSLTEGFQYSDLLLGSGSGCPGSNKVVEPQQKKKQLRNVNKTLSPNTGNRKSEKDYCLETARNELLVCVLKRKGVALVVFLFKPNIALNL